MATMWPLDRKGSHLVLDNVPAYICRQCGEVYFAEAEVDALQQAMQAVDKQVERIAVPA